MNGVALHQVLQSAGTSVECEALVAVRLAPCIEVHRDVSGRFGIGMSVRGMERIVSITLNVTTAYIAHEN